MRLPLQTIIQIIEQCDLSTKKILASTSRAIRVYAQCILFRHIRLRTVKDVEAFAQYASSAARYILNRKKLNSIRSFTFEPSVYCGWPNGQAYSNVFRLCSIPAVDGKGVSMFQNLKVAYLNVDSNCVGHKLCRNEQFDDSWRTPLSASFLGGVQTIYLEDVCFKLYDEFSSVFRLLGMTQVETVHLDLKSTIHLTTALATQLRSLKTVQNISLNLEVLLPNVYAGFNDLTYWAWAYTTRLSEALLGFARRKDQYPELERIELVLLADFREFIEPQLQSHLSQGNISPADKDWVLNRLKWHPSAMAL